MVRFGQLYGGYLVVQLPGMHGLIYDGIIKGGQLSDLMNISL